MKFIREMESRINQVNKSDECSVAERGIKRTPKGNQIAGKSQLFEQTTANNETVR